MADPVPPPPLASKNAASLQLSGPRPSYLGNARRWVDASQNPREVVEAMLELIARVIVESWIHVISPSTLLLIDRTGPRVVILPLK